MKLKYILLVFIIGVFTSKLHSQDILGALTQVAEMENEANGETNNPESSLSEEQRQQLEEYWEENTKDARDFIDGLNKPYHQCIALIGIFSYQIITLARAAEEAETCQMKYDYLGLQSLLLTGGLTLMPCAEELSNFGTLERDALMNDFYSSLFSCDENRGFKWTPLAEKAPRIVTQILVGFDKHDCNPAPDRYDSNADLDVIYFYFHPESYVRNIIDIGQRMEALGCGG